jgi:sec-independent protein translocase protein TatA
MGSFSIWHWIVVAVIVLLLFGGRGKLSGLMGDAAKGINAFKKGLKDTDDPSKKAVEDDSQKTIDATAKKEDDARA